MTREVGWKTIMDRVEKKLSVWKVRTLSIGGWSLLLKSVLGALGIYYVSLFLFPITVSKILESLCAQFFCGWEGDTCHTLLKRKHEV